MSSADLLLTNGVVRTLDPTGAVAQAVAVRGERIVAVGGSEELSGLVGAGTRVIDLGGRTVIPAFTDSHTHFKRASLVRAYFIDFREVAPRTVSDVVAAVKAKAANARPGSWVQGDGLNDQALVEQRFPVRQELDAVSDDHPVVLRSIGRHVAVANSLALQLAGIDRDTVAPSGGRIAVDDAGEPTGVLYEQGKLRLDMTRADTVIPRFDAADRVSALAAGLAELHSYGIASIHEMAREADEIGDYLRLKEQGGLSVRIQMYIRGIEADTRLEHLLALGFRSGLGDAWFRLAGVKFSIDGSALSRGAALLGESYPGQPGSTGIVRIEQEELNRAVELSNAAGLQIAVHAVGQRAAQMALQAYQRVADDEAYPRLRHRIEHSYFPDRQGELARMRELGLVWSTQPAELFEVGDSWIRLFGEDWLDGSVPLRSALELGIPVQLNSDYPVTSMNPFVGIKAAVHRRTASGATISPGQAISVDEALRAMTVTPAYVAHNEDVAGSVSVGKWADLAVLSEDPYSVPAGDLDQIDVTTTIVGGRVRFIRDGEADGDD